MPDIPFSLKPDLPAPKPELKSIRRKAMPLSSDHLVRIERLNEFQSIPLMLYAALEGVDLRKWLPANWEAVQMHLRQHGALLFRDFRVETADSLEEIIRACCGEPLEYVYRSTPRSEVSGRIYTSTEYPADQEIPLHNELAYSRHWPMKLWFLCLQPAERGGGTPIADSRSVYAQIPQEVRDPFIERGVMYIRNYGAELDLPWYEVFQTSSRDEVTAYCSAAGISCEWLGGDRLRTREICQATAQHPVTGNTVWFNQAHLFHVSSLPSTVRHSLCALYGEEGLPRHACYGDASPIPEEALDAIRAAYRETRVLFQWKPGDVLLLDNMLVAHGRMPFAGARRVVVGMAEGYQG